MIYVCFHTAYDGLIFTLYHQARHSENLMFNWQKFLTNHPHFQNDTPLTLNLEAEKPLQLCALEQYQLIMVEGADALTFLQGQCTCDFTKLTEENTTLGAHCTPKGRMISSFLAAKTAENQYTLKTYGSTASRLLNALKKYAVFSRVSLHIEQTIACFGLLGDQIKRKEFISTLPIERKQNQTKSFAHRVIEHTQASEIWINAIHLAENTQLNSLPTIANQAWDLMLIRNGIGEVRESTIEELLPQEINLQLTGGVDFKKGCYTGQEIIARMHYRGNLKKHMYRGIASSLNPAYDINHQNLVDADTHKNIGKILLAVKTGHTSAEFLSIANDDYIDNKTAQLLEHPEAKIEWLPLPYAIT